MAAVSDWELARDLLGGGYPTSRGALALATLICWFAVICVATAAGALGMRRARGSNLLRRRGVRSAVCLGAGVLALLGGALHHAAGAEPMCCGSDPAHVREALDLAR